MWGSPCFFKKEMEKKKKKERNGGEKWQEVWQKSLKKMAEMRINVISFPPTELGDIINQFPPVISG